MKNGVIWDSPLNIHRPAERQADRWFGGGNPASKTYAADTFAQLTRDQWASYQQNFVPFEDKLITMASDPAVITNAMSAASMDVASAFKQAGGVTERRLSGLGLSLNADEQAASDRSMGLARSLADVQAQNMARDVAVERQQSIIGNPTPRIGSGAGRG